MARHVAVCREDGCNRPAHCKGQCRRHYDRHREHLRHRIRDDRVLALRARNRAVSWLVAESRERFEVLLAEARIEVTREHAELLALAAAEGVEVTDDRQIFRLRPGPRPDDQDAADRLADGAPGCPRCSEHHSDGHRCPACGSDVPAAFAGVVAS